MSSIKTYFSQRDDLQKAILKQLDAAQMQVCVAVAWFTDTVLFQKLLELQVRGVCVELIITRHQFNEESYNDYNLVKEGGGVFLQIGTDESLMHHKFCIVDHRTVLNGSFNWTKRANRSNNETLMIIKDDQQSVFEFKEEFDRLKRLAGLEQEVKELEVSKAVRYFSLIKTLIELSRFNYIYPYLQEIKDVEELKHITQLLLEGQYEEAVKEMILFEKKFTALSNVIFHEKEELAFRIRLVSEQIRQSELEETELEEIIASYNRRFILELNPIIALILELKKKLAKKFKIDDEEFQELTEEYEKVNQELKEEEEKDVPDLSVEEAKDIKKHYREASILCHPDSPKCVIKDKAKAHEIFVALSTAYKAKNYAEVKRIYEELKSGHVNLEDLMQSEIDQLRRKLAALEKKLEIITNQIRVTKISEPFITIEKIRDLDEFFAAQKTILQQQKEELENKFYKV